MAASKADAAFHVLLEESNKEIEDLQAANSKIKADIAGFYRKKEALEATHLEAIEDYKKQINEKFHCIAKVAYAFYEDLDKTYEYYKKTELQISGLNLSKGLTESRICMHKKVYEMTQVAKEKAIEFINECMAIQNGNPIEIREDGNPNDIIVNELRARLLNGSFAGKTAEEILAVLKVIVA